MCLNASFESEEHGRQSLPAQDLIGTGKTQNITAINKNECFDHWRQFVCKKNYGTIKQTYFSWEVTWNDFCICYCFRCCVMNFFGCIKEIMDNSFFYGMMEENTSKKRCILLVSCLPSHPGFPSHTICRSKRCRSWKSFWLRRQRKLEI